MNRRERKPAHPGGLIKRLYLDVLGMSVTELALILGVSRKTISKIVNEHASVTPNMALRLSKAFGTTAKLWMNVQQTYDLWMAANESKGWQDVERIQFPAA